MFKYLNINIDVGKMRKLQRISLICSCDSSLAKYMPIARSYNQETFAKVSKTSLNFFQGNSDASDEDS